MSKPNKHDKNCKCSTCNRNTHRYSDINLSCGYKDREKLTPYTPKVKDNIKIIDSCSQQVHVTEIKNNPREIDVSRVKLKDNVENIDSCSQQMHVHVPEIKNNPIEIHVSRANLKDNVKNIDSCSQQVHDVQKIKDNKREL